MRAIGYLLVCILILSGLVAGGAYVAPGGIGLPDTGGDPASPEDTADRAEPDPVPESTEEAGSEPKETPQDRFATLNESCEFHNEVPDTEWENINMRIEGRALATHDGHLEGLMHKKTNQIREAQGVDRLRCDPQLVRIARNHSRDMAERNFYSHTNPDGDGPSERARKADYDCTVGENLNIGVYATYVSSDGRVGSNLIETPDELARSVINSGLYQSPEHRRNMLAEDWSVMGVGVYVDDEYFSKDLSYVDEYLKDKYNIDADNIYVNENFAGRMVYVTQMFCSPS